MAVGEHYRRKSYHGITNAVVVIVARVELLSNDVNFKSQRQSGGSYCVRSVCVQSFGWFY